MADPRLEKRPGAGTPTIEKLDGWMKGGRVRPPRFQRALRRPSVYVISLVNSIARGFPIGVLRLAFTQAERARIEEHMAVLPLVRDRSV